MASRPFPREHHSAGEREGEEELGETRALEERLQLLGGLGTHFVGIHLCRPAVANKELAIDEHMPHRARAATEQDARRGVAPRAVEAIHVQYHQVGALPLLERADLLIDL